MRRLTDQQRKYAEARVRGDSISGAAEEAGSKRPAEAGSRWEKDPAIREYMATLRRAAEAMAQAETQLPAQVAQLPAQHERNYGVIVDLASSLAVASNLVRATGGAKVTKSWKEENATLGTVRVKREEDGGKALEMLIQHYDGKNAPKETSVVLNVNALVGLLDQSRPVEVVGVGRKLLGEGE